MGYGLVRRIPAFLTLFFMLGTALFPCPARAWGEFTIKDEAELGKKIRISIRSSFPIVDDPEIVEYISRVTKRLMAHIPPQPFEYSVSVVRHNAINAFAAPGGNLFVFTGLILAMDHESELAGVLSHEIAHATQRHIAGRIQQMQKISLLSLAGMLLGGFVGGGNVGPAIMAGSLAAGQAAQLSYSRADETDADNVGMRYLIAAGYPPRGMVGAFEKIRRQQWLVGSNIPTYLSTHPDVMDRINILSARIRTMTAALQSRKDDDADFLRIQALVRSRYSDADLALAVFDAQEKIKGPQQCLAYMGKGIINARRNDVREAQALFEKALACNPKEELIVREAGIFHYMKGSKSTATTLLNRAVSMNAKDYMALFFCARLLDDSGNSKTAQEYFREILVRLPEDSEVHFFYAQSLAQTKQMFRAYLHMAYSYLYVNDRKKTEQNLQHAKNIAKSADELDALRRIETLIKERKEILGG